jgi:hypothetical protein
MYGQADFLGWCWTPLEGVLDTTRWGAHSMYLHGRSSPGILIFCHNFLSAALPDEEKVDEVVRVLKSALPRQNYIVLKYLMEFLVQVSIVL